MIGSVAYLPLVFMQIRRERDLYEQQVSRDPFFYVCHSSVDLLFFLNIILSGD